MARFTAPLHSDFTSDDPIEISLARAARTAERAQQQIQRAQLQVYKADAVIRRMRVHLRHADDPAVPRVLRSSVCLVPARERPDD